MLLYTRMRPHAANVVYSSMRTRMRPHAADTRMRPHAANTRMRPHAADVVALTTLVLSR
jgi:hypothetical protein